MFHSNHNDIVHSTSADPHPCRLLAFLAASLLLASSLSAQSSTSRIFGVVKDKSGSVIENAKVSVIDVNQNSTREATTDSEGAYQVLQLRASTYKVSVEQTGFLTADTQPTPLNIGQALRVDVTLEVGQLNQTVQVEADTSGVETVSSTLGASVTTRPILNLPLNGRNALDLALLQPGVTPTDEGSFYNATTGNTNSTGGFSISGGRNDSITYLLDGGLNNSSLYNDIVYNPNPDTIQEFRILTSNYNAEYGRNAGGVISIITKSGTNELHGSLFDFLRNNVLDANSFFSNQQGQPRDILKRNQFGFSVGGPVVVPKLFKGRNKLLFFGSYQGQRQTETMFSGQVTVFTPAELAGNFSNSAGGGPPAALVSFLQTHPGYQPNPTLAAQGIIDPFQISPIAANYIKAGLIPTSATGFLFPRANGINNSDEATGKIDYIATESQRLSVTLGGSTNPITNPFDGTNVAGFGSLSNLRRYFANANFTSVISPVLLNEFRATAQRQNRLRSAPVGTAPTPAQLGIAITPDDPNGPPVLDFSSGLAVGYSGYGPSRVVNNTYQFSDTLTWTRGKHTIKAGFYISPFQDNTVFDFFVNGVYNFTGTNGQATRTGNDRADFLLGLPDNFAQYSQAPSNIRTTSYAGFGQDEWRVTPRLVLTLGLRYDYDTPRRDTQGRSFSLAYGQQSQRFPNAPPGLLFPGDPGVPNGANCPDRNNFGPRFGFAWDPTGNAHTSIRGGFGVFYDVLKGEDLYQFNGVPPFAGSAYLIFATPGAGAVSSPNPFAQPYAAAGQPNPFPSKPPSKNIDFYSVFGSFAADTVDPHLRTPYIYQYNLSLQHQLGHDLIAEVDYVGNSSHKLTALVDSNPFILGTTTRLLNSQSGSRPDSYALMSEFINGSNASYNSMQSSLQRRYSEIKYLGGVSLQLSYTLAHSIDDASGFEQPNSRVPYYNHHAFRASSDQDIRSYVSLSGLWDLPIGKIFHRNRLTSGWSLNPIYSYRTGTPLDISAGFGAAPNQPGPSGAGDANLVRPILVAPVVYYDPRLTQAVNGQPGNYWFNPNFLSTAGITVDSLAAVTDPAARTYGTLGRNSLRGPTRTNLDLRLSKSTYLYRERVRAEVIGEFFNVFNHAQFRNPDLNFNSGTFGIISQTYDPRIIQLALKVYF